MSSQDRAAAVTSKKILSEKPTELEENIAKMFVELEITVKDLAADLRDLSIASVKEVDVGNGRNAIVIFVPYRQHKKYQKIQGRLIRELEKKLSGRHVMFVAQRTILSKAYIRRSHGQQRPRSRTLTAVHDAILNDLVYPTQIVGKRVRVSNGTKTLKVYLDPKDASSLEGKLKTFAAVYRKLTNKNVEFLFPADD